MKVAAPQTALITGASSGIGEALARLLAGEKTHLILAARRKEKLQALAAELSAAHGVRVDVLPADLSLPDEPLRVVAEVERLGLQVDLLVNNAGFGLVGPLADRVEADLAEMVQVNVSAVVRLTRLLLPGMLARKRGGILNLASTAAYQPGPTMAVYFASKAFVLSFSEALYAELAGTGVKVTCLCPGPTDTGFSDRSGIGETLLFRLGMLRADYVARAGLRALRRGQAICTPGFFNWLTATAVRLTPRPVVRFIAQRLLVR